MNESISLKKQTNADIYEGLSRSQLVLSFVVFV